MFSLFAIQKPGLQRIDIDVKYVNVHLGSSFWSSFEYSLIGRSPRCYIPNFVEISPLVPEK